MVEITVNEYEPRWTLPGGTPEQYVLEQLQEHTRITDPNALQRSWVTLNRKASSFPTYAREGSSLQGLLAVVMVLFSDLSKSL